ncbi:MAG TPA: LysR family transcriptional regulator [Usitatibacter sp.]|nr:LysR family transcriptional regulator [Usitatibacter sp.]
MAQIELKALRAFVKVAEMGNISHAAMALGLTQSSLSRIVAGFERQLGTALFHRTGRGVQLTEAGDAVMARARNIVVNAEQLQADIHDFGQAPSGVVTLALLPSLMRDMAGDLYEVVRKKHPGITLRMLEGFSNQVEEWLSDGRADVGVLSRYRGALGAGEEVISSSHLVLVGARPVNDRKTIRFRDLARIPLVLPASPNGLRIAVNDVARRLRLRLDVLAEADSLEAQKAIVRREECFAVLGSDAVAGEAARGTLHARTIVEPQLPRLLVMATTTQRPLSRATREVAAFVKRLAMRQG